MILEIFSNFCHFEPLRELLEGPSRALIPYVSISILCYQISFELDHFQDFFTREKFSLPKTILKQVAQGQYVVSDTRCPALSDCELE